MKKILLGLALVIAFCAQAQHTISGTFSPAGKYEYVLAYRLKAGSKSFIADTKVKDGRFTLQIPAQAQTGMYRLVYALPQDEFYFDVIYNGKEDIELAFDAKNGVAFSASEENQLMTSYFQTIGSLVGQLVDFYIEGKSDQKEFEECAEQLRATQEAYEKQSENLVVQNFIVANRPYIPEKYESAQDYIAHKKEHYFDHLKVDNPVLQASEFLTDKLRNYVFTALPPAPRSSEETEKAIQDNVKNVAAQLASVADSYKFEVFYTLWKMSSDSGLNKTTDFIYDTYLKPLAEASKDPDKARKIAVEQRLRIGATAPDIVWKDDSGTKKLSGLEKADNYLLVFWSSTCSHCLKELPLLHKELKDYPASKIRVVAVGLEDDKTTWIPESAKLPRFEHAIALGKWQSDYANLYDIHKTPTYYLLDSEKRIVAKPESDKEVIELLRK